MKRSIKKAFFLIAFTIAIQAQPDRFEERIVAVVEDRIITSGQVEMAIMIEFGEELPSDSAEFERIYVSKVEQLVDEELLLLASERESVTVDESVIENAFNKQWNYMVERSGGEKGLEERLKEEGYTLESFKRKTRERIRDYMKKQAYIEKHFRKINVTESEVDSFYSQFSDSLPLTPPSVNLGIILVRFLADSTTLANARERINLALERIENGEEFSKVAHEMSEDSLTAMKGGIFSGKFQRGIFKQKDLDSLIFALKVGEVGGPIQTPSGFHLFKVIDISADGITLAHILARASITSERNRELVSLADSIFRSVSSEPEKFDSIGEFFSGIFGVEYIDDYGEVPKKSLPEQLKKKVDSASIGEIISPDVTEDGIAIYKIVDMKEGKKLDAVEDREILREFARQYKLRKQIEEHIARLRKQFYVEVRI